MTDVFTVDTGHHEDLWEAQTYTITEAGALSIYAKFFDRSPMVTYAPGFWRSIIRT